MDSVSKIVDKKSIMHYTKKKLKKIWIIEFYFVPLF